MASSTSGSRHAPRCGFGSAGKPTAIVLSVGNATELMAFHRMLDEILAESARRQAAFFGQLEPTASPAPAGPGTAAPIPQKKAGGEIAWDNFIDFSK